MIIEIRNTLSLDYASSNADGIEIDKHVKGVGIKFTIKAEQAVFLILGKK